MKLWVCLEDVCCGILYEWKTWKNITLLLCKKFLKLIQRNSFSIRGELVEQIFEKWAMEKDLKNVV